LLDGLQKGTQSRKGGVADQSVHGRMGLGAVYKGETSRMKNVSIMTSGGSAYYILICSYTHICEQYTHSFADLPELMTCKEPSFRESEMVLMVTLPRSVTSHSVPLF
jgi:hypothetical protein